MSLEWEQEVVDSRDPVELGRWWQRALGWVIVNDEATEFEIRPTADRIPGLIFVPVDERKVVKNRLHLDFRPDWVVLADPEGNEFCVLRSRDTAS